MGTIRQEELNTGPFPFYDIDGEVSRMIKPIFVLCVFIAAVHAYPFRVKSTFKIGHFGRCKMACHPCMVMTGFCSCNPRCSPFSKTKPCKAGQVQEVDKCGCKTCGSEAPWSERGCRGSRRGQDGVGRRS